MNNLDKKDCIILNLLQENCRMTLTELSLRVGLSIDAVKKRIKRMIKDNIFDAKIQIRPRNFGFSNIVEAKIKLHNNTKKEYDEFIGYLKDNPFVAEIIITAGYWDLTVVIISKDALDLGRISGDIRNRFGKIINDWSESLTTLTHKFERYDMLKVMGYDKKNKNDTN